MRTKQFEAQTIDEYIASQPREVRPILQKIRQTIRRAAPEAEEAIKYQIPTFTLKGNLVHFGAFKNHMGFYPNPSGFASLQKELSRYEGGKGTIRFPLEEPIPLDLI